MGGAQRGPVAKPVPSRRPLSFALSSWLVPDRIPACRLRCSHSPLSGVPTCVRLPSCVPMEPTQPLCYGRVLATPGYGSLLRVLYRVFDLPEELRTRLRAKRAKAAATTAEVVQAATADTLPKLVAALRELGFRGDGKTRPARSLGANSKSVSGHIDRIWNRNSPTECSRPVPERRAIGRMDRRDASAAPLAHRHIPH